MSEEQSIVEETQGVNLTETQDQNEGETKSGSGEVDQEAVQSDSLPENDASTEGETEAQDAGDQGQPGDVIASDEDDTDPSDQGDTGSAGDDPGESGDSEDQEEDEDEVGEDSPSEPASSVLEESVTSGTAAVGLETSADSVIGDKEAVRYISSESIAAAISRVKNVQIGAEQAEMISDLFDNPGKDLYSWEDALKVLSFARQKSYISQSQYVSVRQSFFSFSFLSKKG